MEDRIQSRSSRQIERLLSDLFEIGAVYHQGSDLAFSLIYRYDPSRTTALIRDRLKTAGYTFDLKDHDETLLLTINPHPKRRIPPLNIALFLATLFTVYVVPVFMKNRFVTGSLIESVVPTVNDLADGAGIEFMLALMSILIIHEMGHYIAGRRRHIVTSWPYFIPAPPPSILGTFGAVIKSKSPFWNRRDLVEVGAAGPIAGWFLAVGWLLYGLTTSSVAPPEFFAQTGEMAFTLEGESLLMKSFVLIIIGPMEAGYFYQLSEAAFAGWVGLLVTAINLLPIGQLDGGHILYGLSRNRQRVFGRIALVILLALGFSSPMWWIFAAFGLFFGINHPPTVDDRRPLTATAIVLGVISILIMIVSFTPTPFR
jgi:membrane-associated protease RseP (regulator of RpoE activity)